MAAHDDDWDVVCTYGDLPPATEGEPLQFALHDRPYYSSHRPGGILDPNRPGLPADHVIRIGKKPRRRTEANQ